MRSLSISQKEHWRGGHAREPEHALIFHCATTADEKQDLLFGAYICAQLKDAQFVAKEIGLFHRGGHPEELRVLKRFVKGSAFELGTEDEFRRKVFLKYLKAGALIVAYDAPSEISRIAVKWNKSMKRRRAFSFYFRLFRDKKTGKIRPSGFEPGISIESLDAAKAIYRPIKYAFHDKDAEQEEEQQFSNVHILDLKTLTAVLTGETYTFSSASEMFGAPASRARKTGPRVTKPAIEQLLRDVTGELELLNRLKQELEQHPVDLVPERCLLLGDAGQRLLFFNGSKRTAGKVQDSEPNQWFSRAGVFRRACRMHDPANSRTSHLRRFPCAVPSGEQSAQLPGNIVR